MTNLEKIKLIIGDENFKKLKKNHIKRNQYLINTFEKFANLYGAHTISSSFNWQKSPEGHLFWKHLHCDVQHEWGNVELRKISPEEHDLIFKMFVLEYMEWFVNRYTCTEYFNKSELAKKVYEALRCEE